MTPDPGIVAPEADQLAAAEIDLGGLPPDAGNNPLTAVHAAIFGAPVFSPSGRMGGLSALELTSPFYPDIPISRISARVMFVETYRHMLDMLGVSVQAAYGGSGMRVSAAVQLARSIEVHESSTYFLLTARAESDPIRLTKAPRMRTGLYPQDDVSRRIFYKAFGDSWISEITLGGNLYALFEVDTYSRSEREELRANFKLAASGGELKAGFRKTFSELVGKRSIKVTYIQEGGKQVLQGIEGLEGVDQVLAAIQNLWKTVQDDPALVGWTRNSYEAVDDIPRPPLFLSVPRYQWAVEQVARRHAVAKERLAALQFALENPQRFLRVDQTATEQWIGGLEQYIQELEKLAAQLEGVEIPEGELEERLAQLDRDPRLPSEQALPQEHPLFELFSLPLGREAFRTFRDFDRRGICHRRHTEVLTPTRLDISPDNRTVRYEYRLDAIGRRRNCGGGWKNADRGSFTVYGFVLAELDIERTKPGQATIKIGNVSDNQPTKNQYETINFGGDPLIQAIQAKNGSTIAWEQES